jgi:hypothetical protein
LVVGSVILVALPDSVLRSKHVVDFNQKKKRENK